MAKIRWKDSSSTYFYYDGNLQRYGMKDAAGTVTYFLWDGLDVLQELNADHTVKEEHSHARMPIAGIGQLVESFRPGQAAALQKIYPIQDPRRTMCKWIKADGTTVLASREYDAFGTIMEKLLKGTMQKILARYLFRLPLSLPLTEASVRALCGAPPGLRYGRIADRDGDGIGGLFRFYHWSPE